MRTGFVGYACPELVEWVSAAHADVATIAPAIAMQITAIRCMIAYYAWMATLHQHKEWL